MKNIPQALQRFFAIASIATFGAWSFAALVSCTKTTAEVPSPSVAPQPYPVTTPVVMDVPADRQYVAQVQNASHIELCTRVEGFIERVEVDEGQRVTKGQLIFALGKKEFETDLRRAHAKLQSADSALKMEGIELANTKTLLGKKIVAQVDCDLAQAKVDAAAAAVEEANADVSAAEWNLSRAEVRAPFDGTINRLPKKAGSMVNAGDVLTTLSSEGDVFVYFNVSEQEYLEFITRPDYMAKDGLSLELADGRKYAHRGRIETLDGTIDKATGTIAFRGRFPNPDRVLRHGASGRVTVHHTLSHAMVIPQKCTFEVQHRLCVYRIGQDHKVELCAVEPTLRLPNHFVIGKGLGEQDQIIFEGIQLVQEGQIIAPEARAWNESSPL